VTRYLATTDRHPHIDLDELSELLQCETVNADDAECLIAFVPMAFAHAILSPLGVGLPTKFLVRDFDTGVTEHGWLREEPIFVAARTVADAMLSADAERQRVLEVAAGSAEMQVAKDLKAEDGSMRDIVLTEPLLGRLLIRYLAEKNAEPSWKFWRRLKAR
jgi:hypothetical protein